MYLSPKGVCHSRSAEEHARIEKIVAVSNLMLAINSAFNFIIYMLRGDKFRRVLSRKLAQLFNRSSAGRCVNSQFESPRYERHCKLLYRLSRLQ